MKDEIIELYSNDDITLDKIAEDKYRISVFKNCNWAGELIFTKDKVLVDDITKHE